MKIPRAVLGIIDAKERGKRTLGLGSSQVKEAIRTWLRGQSAEGIATVLTCFFKPLPTTLIGFSDQPANEACGD